MSRKSPTEVVKEIKSWLHDATLHEILRAIALYKCGRPLKFNEIVTRNVTQVESDSTSAILRARSHATISVVAKLSSPKNSCKI